MGTIQAKVRPIVQGELRLLTEYEVFWCKVGKRAGGRVIAFVVQLASVVGEKVVRFQRFALAFMGGLKGGQRGSTLVSEHAQGHLGCGWCT